MKREPQIAQIMSWDRLLSKARTRKTMLLLLAPAMFVCWLQGFHAQTVGTLPEQEPVKEPSPGAGLIRTDVMVFDRQGHFVDNLKREEFNLLVDGSPQPIMRLTQVSAGSPDEERQWVEAQALRPDQRSPAMTDGAPPVRSIFFFLDNLHMSAESTERVRAALSRFIDDGMGANNRVALISATRQIGFMHETSGDRSDLHATLEHFTYRRPDSAEENQPAMTAAQALAILRHNSDVLSDLTKATLEENPQLRKDTQEKVESLVRDRAESYLRQAIAARSLMFDSLSDLLFDQMRLPGRKILFLLSDGFDPQSWQMNDQEALLRISEEAARAGTMIYVVDTSSPSTQPGKNGGGESQNQMKGLRLLAAETGGRSFRDLGELNQAVDSALKETSRYYLLSWRVQPQMLMSGNSKLLKVFVTDRHDCTVRLRQNTIDIPRYLNPRPPPGGSATTDMVSALRSPTPLAGMPVDVYPTFSYLKERGPILRILIQTRVAAPPLPAGADKDSKSIVQVMGAVLGKSGYTEDFFQSEIPVSKYSSAQAEAKQTDVTRSRSLWVGPGAYQVRVALRDAATGRTGSASEWIEVPSFSDDKVALSSIYLSEPKPENTSQMPSVRRRFSRGSRMSFSAQIYNFRLPKGTAAPSLRIEATIIKGNQILEHFSAPPLTIKPDTKDEAIAYEGTISLDSLEAGAYQLEVTVPEQAGNNSASRRVWFWIE